MYKHLKGCLQNKVESSWKVVEVHCPVTSLCREKKKEREEKAKVAMRFTLELNKVESCLDRIVIVEDYVTKNTHLNFILRKVLKMII